MEGFLDGTFAPFCPWAMEEVFAGIAASPSGAVAGGRGRYKWAIGFGGMWERRQRHGGESRSAGST